MRDGDGSSSSSSNDGMAPWDRANHEGFTEEERRAEQERRKRRDRERQREEYERMFDREARGESSV